ncbi:MAG: hypothetical protein RLZZ135_841 [Cyanobacteriota bacterium]|jgi:hypothetical protein
MKKNFIDQLFGLMISPYGLVGLAIGILIVIYASRSRPAGWMLFSLCCFAASLNEAPRSQWIKVIPPLLFPFQQIRSVGRPLAIVLLLLLVILAFMSTDTWRRWILPPPLKYLIVVQGAIVLKTLLYGNLEFSLISGLTFGCLIFVLRMGPGRWLQDDRNFHLAARSLAVAVSIFITINTYQYAIDRYAVTFHQGRFLGTTDNPQQAALLLSSAIPCLIFLSQRTSSSKFIKVMWAMFLIATLFFLFMTGSRMGVLIALTSVILFYRNNGGAWFQFSIGLAVLAVIVTTLLDPALLISSSGVDTVSGRVTSTENTRAVVWTGMWQTFQDNLLFGLPLEQGRMGFGENSWLAAAANLGLIGVIPMVMMGWESLKLMWQLDRLSQRQPHYFFYSSTAIAGIGSLLVGSLFEPFLLGNITFVLLAFLTYLIMGAYLIEVDRARTYYLQTRAPQSDRAGVYQ